MAKQLSRIADSGNVFAPFRPLSDEEDAAVIQVINESNADIIWVGLGAPKQEKWMHEHWGKDIW